MKKNLLSTLIIFALLLTMGTALRNPNNPPTGRTGAPGETTCQTSGCHSGGSYSGTAALSGLPDTIVPGTAYTITFLETSNCARAGFEMTCLNSSNAACGTFTAGSGSSISTANSKKYIRQSTPKVLSSGATSWSFTWTAPATIVGGVAKFYFVALQCNGNGNESGDNVIANTLTLPSKVTTATQDLVEKPVASVYHAGGQLHIISENSSKINISLFNLAGQIVLQQTTNNSGTISTSEIQPGIYIAMMTQDGKTSSQKVMIQ